MLDLPLLKQLRTGERNNMKSSKLRAVEDELHTEMHITHTLDGVEIDEGIVDLVKTFWDRGGVSYCSCQGHVNPEPKLLSLKPTSIIDFDYNVEYVFDNDYSITLSKPFIVIHKTSLHILQSVCKNTKWSVDKVIEGDGGYELLWIKNLPSIDELRYIVLKDNKVRGR